MPWAGGGPVMSMIPGIKLIDVTMPMMMLMVVMMVMMLMAMIVRVIVMKYSFTSILHLVPLGFSQAVVGPLSVVSYYDQHF